MYAHEIPLDLIALRSFQTGYISEDPMLSLGRVTSEEAWTAATPLELRAAVMIYC